MNAQIKFSIIIPTRNRIGTLEATIKTCLAQNYDNFEIIISDNMSDDGTEEMIKALKFDKIKYYKTPELLPMHYNFRYALSKAEGDYLIILGADDALHFHALYMLNKIINVTQYRYQAITWQMDEYKWYNPDRKIDSNIIGLNNIKGCQEYDGEEMLKKVVEFENPYSTLPMFYMKSAISREFISQLSSYSIDVFEETPPDICSGIIISKLIDKYLFVGFPLSFAGTSPMSGGVMATVNPEAARVKETLQLCFKYSKNNQFNTYFPELKNVYHIVIEHICKELSDKFPEVFGTIAINYKQQIRAMVTDLRIWCKTTEKMEEVFNFSLAYIQEVLKTEPVFKEQELERWFQEEILSEYKSLEKIKYIGQTKLSPYFTSDKIRLDADNFNITDIYQAVELCDKIMNYKDKIENYINREFTSSGETKLKLFINKLCDNISSIGIYGTGECADDLYKAIIQYEDISNIKIYAFDSDSSKLGTTFRGYPIMHYEKIANIKPEKVIIASYASQEAIYNKICKYESDDIHIVKPSKEIALLNNANL